MCPRLIYLVAGSSLNGKPDLLGTVELIEESIDCFKGVLTGLGLYLLTVAPSPSRLRVRGLPERMCLASEKP